MGTKKKKKPRPTPIQFTRIKILGLYKEKKSYTKKLWKEGMSITLWMWTSIITVFFLYRTCFFQATVFNVKDPHALLLCVDSFRRAPIIMNYFSIMPRKLLSFFFLSLSLDCVKMKKGSSSLFCQTFRLHQISSFWCTCFYWILLFILVWFAGERACRVLARSFPPFFSCFYWNNWSITSVG